MQIKNIIFILCLLFSFSSCIESFWPEIDKYQNLLVVDGLLTNNDDPTIVRLSISSSINDGELIQASGAEMYITDETMLEIPLTETEAGTYQVMDESFKGEIGNSYQLHILLPNGKEYISDKCKLTIPSPIDSVFGVIESASQQNSTHDLEGMQFYINNHSNMDDTCYYRWNLIQTYKFKSSFNIDFTWEGAFIPYPKPDSLRTCWHTNQINSLYTYSTQFLDKPIIKHFPLCYSSADTKELSIRYSLLVQQFTLPKQAFVFWDALRQQNIQSNLYSQQPIQIKGNIHSVNNIEEPVLGYFTVAGITEKRIYVNRPALKFYYEICTPNTEAMIGIGFAPASPPIYLTQLLSGGLAMGNQDLCFDCRLDDGSLTPPDFWEE
jgi:hypothetical protein